MTSQEAGTGSTQIVMYGAPGVGKLTVGRALTGLTGFKLAHNHLAIDFVSPVFEFGSEGFDHLRDAVRLEMAREATLQGAGLIHTLALRTSDGEDYLKRLCTVVESNGGRIEFVQLTCNVEALKGRIDSPERRAMQKVITPELLQLYLDSGSLTKLVADRESLAIDNTDLAPVDPARRIVEHFDLPRI